MLMDDSLFQESYRDRSSSLVHILYWLQAQEVAGKENIRKCLKMTEDIIPKALNLYLKSFI